MSRYIDADALIEVLKQRGIALSGTIADQPSIDIVRCGECKFWAGHSIGNLDDWAECRWREDEATDADDFCSYGERNDNE